MGKPIKQNQVAIWLQSVKFTEFEPFAAGDKMASLTGISIPLVNVAPTYTRDRFGAPLLLSLDETAPGELPGATLTIFEQKTLNFFEDLIKKRCPIALQRRFVDCGVLDDPFLWDKIMFMDRGRLTVYNPGDGPALEFNGQTMQAAGTLAFTRVIFLGQTSLSSQTTLEVEDILAIGGVSDNICEDCGDGYPGPDRVLFASAAAGAGVPADISFTNTGGGNWTIITNNPFGNDEDAGALLVRRQGVNTVRHVVGRTTTDAGSPAEIAYADTNWGDEGNATYTQVSLNTANGAVIEALGWPSHERLYAASAGDIFSSSDQGETFGATPIYTGAVVINGFARDPGSDDVWAFGETNLLLREQNKSGTFSARVGPSGGGAFTALVVADDGTIFAGNGQALFRSNNKAANAGGWTQIRDFGSNKVIVKIQTVGEQPGLGGASQVIRVVVDDTTPGTGSVYTSTDGGNTFTEATQLTNTGYNDAYFSQADDNQLTVVGDTVGGFGAIHQLTAES